MVGLGREFDESEAADTTGESAEKEYSFERKGTSGVYEAKRVMVGPVHPLVPRPYLERVLVPNKEGYN